MRRLVTVGLLVLIAGGGPAVASVADERPEPSSGWVSTVDGAVWPLDPRPPVVAGFDPPLSAYGAGHRGVDLLGAPGQAVRAARAGRVSYAGVLAGRGVVVVDHGTTRTTYEPVAAEVPLGATVAAGETLGRLEPRNGHCWPATCLHWGLVEGTTYRNPLTLVGAGPVRLLPLAPGAALPLPHGVLPHGVLPHGVLPVVGPNPV